MSTPAGLDRFSRSMATRYNGKCSFCAEPTRSGVDFAALSSGKWITVCVACSQSIVAQVRGTVRNLAVESSGLNEEQTVALAALIPANLAEAMADNAPDAVAYDALVKLQNVLATLDTLTAAAKPVDPRLAALQAVADNAQATPRDRDFAGSLAAGLVKYGTLTDRQAPHADRLIARYATANGAPAAPAATAGVGLYQHDNGAVRKVYMTQNDRLGCKLLTVMGEHGSFQYEKGGTRTVSEALAAGTAHLMTQDEATAFGRLHSFCCNCAKDLDDDRSVAAGYGPTCADNNGWHYPSYEQAAAILQRPVTGPNGKVYMPPAA